MTLKQAVERKYRGVPKNYEEARKILKGCECLVCGSTMLLAVTQFMQDHFVIHCNHCWSKVPFDAFLNRPAWRMVAQWGNRQRRSK